MEAFSELISHFHLSADIYHNAKVCGDWRIEEHKPGQTCFHMVTQGACILDVPGQLSCQLNQGDLVIFPREINHTMTPLQSLTGPQQHLEYCDAQNLPGTGMLCAEITFQHQGSSYLLDALPPVFIITYQSNKNWLSALFDMILHESLHLAPASGAILNRLSELLFSYAIRQHMLDKPEETGLLALYGHPRLGKVINAIHQSPAKNWTVNTMAQLVAQSRTLFFQSFKQTSGWTPMQYLTWWRMQLAWRDLHAGRTVAQTAEVVGYNSESAFARAFQKQFGYSVGSARKQKRHPQS